MMEYNTEGWVYNPEAIESTESVVGVFGAAAPFLTGSGKGKIVCLHDNYKKIGLDFPVRSQGNLGSCVSFGTAGAVDILKATEIAEGQREEFKACTSEEPIYFGARVRIGKNSIRGAGAVVAHAITYITKYGVLAKGKYGNIDLTEYSVERCQKWGTGSGFPPTLEDISKETIVQEFARVKSWEEFRDSIATGFPIVTGSSLGFSSQTDNEGFCKQSTTWNHSMMGMAVDDSSKRPGGLISNSWGKGWLKIVKRKLNQPDGCFWADADDIDRMMARGDCWSISNFKGFSKKTDSSVAW